MFILYYRPSGKYTKNMENHHFQWVNQLFRLGIFYIANCLFTGGYMYPTIVRIATFQFPGRGAACQSHGASVAAALRTRSGASKHLPAAGGGAATGGGGQAQGEAVRSCYIDIYIYILCMSNIQVIWFMFLWFVCGL